MNQFYRTHRNERLQFQQVRLARELLVEIFHRALESGLWLGRERILNCIRKVDNNQHELKRIAELLIT